MNTVVNINKIAKVIKNNFQDIPFAHIFGSASNGIVKKDSDLDIAIWYNGSDPFIKIKVLEAIEPITKGITVDIVNIYDTNPILAHEALSGKVLFIRDEQKENYAFFYSKVAAEYEDKMYWMKKQLKYRGYEVQWSN